MAENCFPLAGADDTQAGQELAVNVGLAPYQAPVCLVLTAPTGLATGGGLLGQLATEGYNHSL